MKNVDFNSKSYKALFKWSEPEFDDVELCWVIVAVNQYGFFELKWVDGGDVVVYFDGVEMSAEESMDEAKAYCLGLFKGVVAAGLAIMMDIEIIFGKEFDRCGWNPEAIRKFCFDQTGNQFDIFDKNNFNKMLDNMSAQNYNEDMDDSDSTEVVVVKPTIH